MLPSRDLRSPRQVRAPLLRIERTQVPGRATRVVGLPKVQEFASSLLAKLSNRLPTTPQYTNQPAPSPPLETAENDR
jgi:hypothetical protein